jgi:hypothetical protein
VAAVSRMTCAMASRGPDSDGVAAHRSIAPRTGGCRLSTFRSGRAADGRQRMPPFHTVS